jgi:hypothetical protein
MSITYEDLVRANKAIETVPIKGKNYAQVNDRVKAFRQICPSGTIETEIISMEDGIVTMKAVVMDAEGHILGTGMAQEKETSSFINKTSYIENCETSAVGRALGFAGIGVDGSMCSAEELVNAITNQNKPATVSAKDIEVLKNMCERKGLDVAETFPGGIKNLTSEQYTDAVKRVSKLKDKE